MAESPPAIGHSQGHLDASGPREVVYCHQCDNEWYQDEHGLPCPRCQSEVTEIVRLSSKISQLNSNIQQISPESDPRPNINLPPTPPGFRSLHNHNPWADDDSDPEEADIEEHVTHGPGGSVFIRQTIRSSGTRDPFGRQRRRNQPDPNNPDFVVRDFQNMLGNLMGPGFRAGRAGRSGPDDLFPHAPFPPAGFRLGGDGSGPRIMGGRFTYTAGNLRPRNADEPQEGGPPVDDIATYASPPSSSFPSDRSVYVISITAPPDQVARLIGTIFGQLGPPPGDGPPGRGGMPPALSGLFASLLNPANARHGDAVYSQEALDQIISTLMEQHPTSNAPGPAAPDAIAALPKKKLDEEMLGPEGKGECSVCMDDVHIGDEVVLLPCSHWFHETCASAWLSEHNTCPICRKGIDGDTPPPNSRRSSNGPASPSTRNEHRARRMSLGARLSSRENTSSRNEARLDSIRSSGRLEPTEESPGSHSSRDISDSSGRDRDYDRSMPGSYRRRDSELSVDNQRDSRRGNTSGSDRSRDSRRSSRSGNGDANNGGPMSWLRDRFSSNGRRHD
jgi:E3 ubiquitin-protein ligase RNF115/126